MQAKRILKAVGNAAILVAFFGSIAAYYCILP